MQGQLKSRRERLEAAFDPERLSRLRRQMRPIAGKDLPPLLGQVRSSIQQERLDDAAIILEGALIADPTNPGAWALAGEIAEEIGASDLAERAYRTAIDHGHQPSILRLAGLVFSLARFDEAAALCAWLVLNAEERTLGNAAAALEERIVLRRGRHS